MTARKTHFDFHAEGLEAACGATPREGAPALELSERRKDVDCIKCLKFMEDYDAEVEATEGANLVRLFNEKDARDNGSTAVTTHSSILMGDIAARNGLHPSQVRAGFEAGWLKR